MPWFRLHCFQVVSRLVLCCSIQLCRLESCNGSKFCCTKTTILCMKNLPRTNQSILYLGIFVFSSKRPGQKLLQARAVKESLQCLLRNNYNNCLFHRVHSFICFSAFAEHAELVSFPASSTCQYRKIIWKKGVIELQQTQISVLQDKEACREWFFQFNLRFSQLYFVKLVVGFSQSVEHFHLDHRMCFFIIQIACNWTATAIIVSLKTRIDSGSLESVESFDRSLFNGKMKFCAYESQLQVKK